MINNLETASIKAKSNTVFNNISPGSIGGIPSKGIFIFKDVLWPVLYAEDEQDIRIMGKVFEVVDKLSTVSRFFAVRYDFHLPEYTSDNNPIRDFHNVLFKELSEKYPYSFISYLWVREQSDSNSQHYHYLLMLDANCIQYPSILNKIVARCWRIATGGTVFFPENGYYSVAKNDVDSYAKLMLRISYFGKKHTKESIAKGIRRVGHGFKKPKSFISKTKHVRAKVILKASDSFKDISLPSCYEGSLDKYFLGKDELPMFHRRRSYYELYDEDKWWIRDAPRWSGHRRNYLFEALITGVSLSGYARKYRLNPERVYANCRQVGGQSLKIIYWAWHRYCFLQSRGSVESYIKNNKLRYKSATKQLRRKPMSDRWKKHFDDYYLRFWPEGWSVVDYCRHVGIVPSTARRYLVDFPYFGLINPFLLRPWL
ncbi:YagK/YfjJ domain-containing protein [Citrobacter portucalensis]|uniref:YagK/YfjJ domain-containing protein n=1 Tax=Citrobacter portucalensis TaxID=1639133 RepID=UPI00226B06B1|nr:inovirus-type Gp2 protein [Citrobacter portucalensis]MCX9022909.1 inovirus Gp2 family protein [Citrobacter portucalensis]